MLRAGGRAVHLPGRSGLFAGIWRQVRMNLAVRRTPKPHVTIKYPEPDFTEMFRTGLRALVPMVPDTGFHGRKLTRNGATGNLALKTKSCPVNDL
jgi:hypothetical protein